MKTTGLVMLSCLWLLSPALAHPPTTQEPTPTGAADPMASFARMVGGEWKVTFASGTSMYSTSHWGPGKHSGRVMTHGEDAAGNPWRGLGVVYWHPGHRQVRTLDLSPYERSVSEGTVTINGETTESVSELYQNGDLRKLVSRDTFNGPDQYHTAQLEEIEPGKLSTLSEWDYFRSRTLTPVQPLPAENPPKPSDRLKALEPLIGHTWDTTVDKADWREAGGDSVHIESTFEWIPYIDAIYARTFALRGNGEPTHILDAYIYLHTGTGRLRCLVLSNWAGRSGVYEGDLTVLEGGALQLDLQGYEGEQEASQVVRFDFEEDRTLHHRIWSVDGGVRTPMLDVHHTVSPMSKGIWYVFQDAQDNYWFGSDGRGLYRFDGTTITQFTTRNGLCNDRIRGIQQHKSGDLLITTLDGVSKFDGQQFVTLPVTEMDSPDQGWVLDPDDVWLPWQTGQKGPYRYDGQTLYHLKFPKHPREDEFYATGPRIPWSPYEVYSVYRDRKGHIWFGTSNFGICRFDGQHLDWMYEDHLTQIEGGGMFGIRSIVEDKDGAFWFCNTQFRFHVQPHGVAGQDNGQISYTRAKGMDLSGTPLREPFFYFMSITDDSNGDLWMATYGGGVWRYDGAKLTHYPVKDGDMDVTLFAITKDNQGDLWLGTQEAGAYRFNGTTFEKFVPPAR